MVYQILKDNVKRVGRTALIKETLWCALSGSGIAFYATGTDVTIHVEGDDSTSGNETEGRARVAVYLDGKRTIDTLIEKPQTQLKVYNAKESKRMLVQLIKLSEAPMSTIGIKSIEIEDTQHNHPQLEPAEVKKQKIEFIGDSITCGFGVDLEDPETPFETATEDVTRAYAYKTAALLDADYSMCSYSGYGIISGYTEDDKPLKNQLVPPLYEKVGFSYGHPYGNVHIEDISWNFSEYQPDLIVLNLGTNDDSYCQDDKNRQALFSKAYADFLRVIRINNPNAYILCTIGTMCQRIADAVEKGMELYKEQSKDKAVSFYKLPLQLPEDGLVSCYHPTAVSHDKAAKLLAREIQRLIE